MALYAPGKEPENIQKRIKTLFDKLDSAYPDKVIVGLYSDHKKWSETVTSLYRALGYPDGASFLEAYGYKYKHKDFAGGRPKSTDPEAIIRAFQKKYPDGSPFDKVDDLFAGTEYESKLKTIKNISSKVFGMPLGKYLLSIGLLKPKGISGLSKTKETIKEEKGCRLMKESIASSVDFTGYDVAELSKGLILSDDGKTVIGFKASTSKKKKIIIPPGVETIEEKAMMWAEFDELLLPKELKHLGKYTLYDSRGFLKKISSVKVAEGNEFFFSDDTAFYSINNGKKRLEIMFDTSLTKYIVPDDVVSFASDAFSKCSSLNEIVLSESVEEFDEASLPYVTEFKEIYIPKTVKRLIPKYNNRMYDSGYRATYHIDEENEYLFEDEDSIYEVLADGSYKLLKNWYTGKGRVLIMEGTSVIGENVFSYFSNFTKLKFPKSLRVIGANAFEGTALVSVDIPEHVKRIESKAFGGCFELTSVQLHSGLEYVAPDAFEGCIGLGEINLEKDGKQLRYDNNSLSLHINQGDNEDRDYFKCFAEEEIRIFDELQLSEREYENDKISFDEKNRIITITNHFTQRSADKDLIKERVECAETLNVGDPVIVRVKGNCWEVASKDGRSLGELSWELSECASRYDKHISILEGSVVSITPKSKRAKQAKYAIGIVRFDIKECKDK